MSLAEQILDQLKGINDVLDTPERLARAYWAMLSRAASPQLNKFQKNPKLDPRTRDFSIEGARAVTRLGNKPKKLNPQKNPKDLEKLAAFERPSQEYDALGYIPSYEPDATLPEYDINYRWPNIARRLASVFADPNDTTPVQYTDLIIKRDEKGKPIYGPNSQPEQEEITTTRPANYRYIKNLQKGITADALDTELRRMQKHPRNIPGRIIKGIPLLEPDPKYPDDPEKIRNRTDPETGKEIIGKDMRFPSEIDLLAPTMDLESIKSNWDPAQPGRQKKNQEPEWSTLFKDTDFATNAINPDISKIDPLIYDVDQHPAIFDKTTEPAEIDDNDEGEYGNDFDADRDSVATVYERAKQQAVRAESALNEAYKLL